MCALVRVCVIAYTSRDFVCACARLYACVCDCVRCACRGRSLSHLCVYICVRVCVCLAYCSCVNQMAKAYDNARQELTELARIKNDFMAKIELAGRDSGARRSSRARRAPPPPPRPAHPRPPCVSSAPSWCPARRAGYPGSKAMCGVGDKSENGVSGEA